MDIGKYIKECHEAAIKKGFYDCPECNGHGFECKGCEFKKVDCDFCQHTERNNCEYCDATGINQNRNIGELLMLIVSELSEAFEAHRNNRFVGSNFTGLSRFNVLKSGKVSYFEQYIKDTFEDELADIVMFALLTGLPKVLFTYAL